MGGSTTKGGKSFTCFSSLLDTYINYKWCVISYYFLNCVYVATFKSLPLETALFIAISFLLTVMIIWICNFHKVEAQKCAILSLSCICWSFQGLKFKMELSKWHFYLSCILGLV